MKKSGKRAVGIISSLILAILFVFSAGIPVRAEETDGMETLTATTYKVGDIIKFGHYEQDGDEINGKEEIEWIIYRIEDDGLFLLSKYGLDAKQYHTKREYVFWGNSDIRKWLNNEFYNEAFSSREKSQLKDIDTFHANIFQPSSDNSTTKWMDKVFLPTRLELKETLGYADSISFMGYNSKLMLSATPYAISRGAADEILTKKTFDSEHLDKYGYSLEDIGRHGTYWFLRTTGLDVDSEIGLGLDDAGNTWFVNTVGEVRHGCFDIKLDKDVAVCPAIFVKMPVRPTSIGLNQSNTVLCYGDSMIINAILTPANVIDKEVTWISSNPAVATVSDGVVKANRTAGTTTITAKTVNGLTATCEVTVYADNNSSNIFADIKYGNWQYNAAKAVYDKGYMTGKGKVGKRVLFSPNTDINRSQFVVSLYAMAGNPKVTYKQQFSDVKSSDWYANAVTWASNNGIVSGYTNGKFGVNDKATREQLALMLYKYAQYKNYDVSIKASTNLDGFTDKNKVDSWAVTAIKWAVERGIISGKGNATEGYRLDPTKGASRIDCAAMMNKFDEVYSGGVKMAVEEELEEPIALPEEEIEDLPAADEEIEDIADEDIVDDEDTDSEEDIEQ